MPAGENGGNGGSTNGYWSNQPEGERQWMGGGAPPTISREGHGIKPPEDTGPPPHVPVLRAAKNVQQANIDRSSLYDPTSATQALGADYLQQRNASNPQPLGSTGAGAVGYDFAPSDERLY